MAHLFLITRETAIISKDKIKSLRLKIFFILFIFCIIEALSFLVLYFWDFYYLLPFPATEPQAAFTAENHLRPLVRRKDLRFTSWIIPDPDLIWRLKPHLNIRVENMNRRGFPGEDYRYFTIQTNSYGFRTPEFKISNNDNTFRIICTGDSNVFGWGVEEKDSFCGILRKNVQGLKCELINMGCCGFTSTQVLRLFKSNIVPLKPNLLIVWVGANDHFKKKGFTDSMLIKFNHTLMGRIRTFLFRHSFIFRLEQKIISMYFHRLSTHSVEVFRVPPKEFENNLSSLSQMCKNQNIELIFILDYSRDIKYREIVEEVAKIGHNDLVSLGELYRENTPLFFKLKQPPTWEEFENDFVDKWIIPGDGHPTFISHKVIAEELFKIIKNKLKINNKL